MRVLVMGPGAIWLFGIGVIWWASRGASDSALGAVMQTFALGLAAGDWVPMVLLPVAGGVLTMTMRTGHQVDRWLFTALSAAWLAWFWRNVHFPLTPTWLTAALVVVAVTLTWSRTMNAWVAMVGMWEMDRAGLTPESNGQ
ncbi:hypothetical protein [Acidipropionibacterium jensenii]|nr:hypothetical protein [Acidipropionibacterium jensenii]MDN5977833.1 hypothetical protein [Acidipropionibacterium jensenii]MDN5996203.1 hypothetical protein [Acidipropionibacterium jensenii]MDN6021861.1 hypothetical protein [Acidipropionibacterium jensenii]MDN6426992.1 hypothetical protein [Acidipropionibacterium jensenii]MDN6441480.1 hypothetical protein [Acidipropionibacterium jensenii]